MKQSYTQKIMKSKRITVVMASGLLAFIVLGTTVSGQTQIPEPSQEKGFNIGIHTRAHWLAQPPSNQLDPLTEPAVRVIIAHTGTASCSTQAECIFQVRTIQTFHIESMNFYDIGYNFLVGGDGEVYEARGWDTQGTHTFGYNKKSICIAFIGTFSQQVPPERQIQAALFLIDDGIRKGKLTLAYNLYGQRQLMSTESPGKELYEIVRTWPHWTDNIYSAEMTEVSKTDLIADASAVNGTKLNTPTLNETNTRNGLYVIERPQWLAQPPKAQLDVLTGPAFRVIIAHTATTSCATQAECIFQVRTIQTFHMESLNFDDIGYNFLVGGDGTVYEARGWDTQGAHTFFYNKNSICIAFIGTFSQKVPTEGQIQAALFLIDDGIRKGKLTSDYKLYGHRQLMGTESPGKELYDIVKTWPHWTDTLDVGDMAVVSINSTMANETDNGTL